MWFAMLPLNLAMVISDHTQIIYIALLLLQVIFYTLALCGYALNEREIKNKQLFIPYYFLFMNVCVLQGFFYLRKHRGTGVWEKAKRR